MEKTMLKTAALGETGLEITRVGFGAWAIGGGGWEFGCTQVWMSSRPGTLRSCCCRSVRLIPDNC